MKRFSKSIVLAGISFMAVCSLLVSCGQKNEDGKKVVVDLNNVSPFNGGYFEGWGTSLCWWANRIGYSDELASRAADLFYDKEKGLGLNIMRYNIGGGDDPDHTHITRTDSAMDGFWKTGTEDKLSGKFEYDFEKDSTQRNVMKRCAAAAGRDAVVEFFSNSAPYFMTNSGCSSGGEYAGDNNLKDGMYDIFAEYLATVAENLQKLDGIKVQSLDPMNEPSSRYWSAMSWKQEGCHFDKGDSQSRMMLAAAKALRNHGLNDVIICGTDETSVDDTAFCYIALSDEAKKVVGRIDTHTYSGSGFERIRNLAQNDSKGLWMSEVDGDGTAGKDAGEMASGLWFANKIISDLNELKSSAWIMWQVIDNHVSRDGYKGNKDSGMPDTAKGFWGLSIADHDNQKIILTKKYYAMAHFSKFMRPGCRIIYLEEKNQLAAFDPNSKEFIVVAVNLENTETDVAYDLGAFRTVAKSASVYRTSGSMSDGENLLKLDDLAVKHKTLSAQLAPNSISTFVVNCEM